MSTSNPTPGVPASAPSPSRVNLDLLRLQTEAAPDLVSRRNAEKGTDLTAAAEEFLVWLLRLRPAAAEAETP